MAEETDRHSVLIVGIDGIPGGPAAATTRLEQKFRLPRAVAEKLVASIPAVVKKDVSNEDAQRYAAAIRSIGADARVVPYSTSKKEKAAVTGIQKPRKPRSGSIGEANRGEVAPSSGGDMSVNRRRDDDAPSAREESTAAGGIVPAAASAVPSDVDSRDETRLAEPAALGTAKTIMGTAFDPSAFALPSSIGSEDSAANEAVGGSDVGGHESGGPSDAAAEDSGFGSFLSDFEAADTEFIDSGAQRPSLFDELMSMEDSGIGISPDAGDFGLSESGEAAAPSPPPRKEAPSAPMTSSTTGPLDPPPPSTAVDQFGNLELGGGDDPDSSGLQLDTEKPHLSGSFRAISVPDGLEDSGGPDLPPPPSKAKGTVRLSALGDPLAEEIERTLRESQPIERPRTDLAIPASDPTGGFSAEAERHRNSNSRFAKVVGWMILLIILAGGVGAGYIFYERWAATLDAKNFAEAPNYFEHSTRVRTESDGVVTFVRGCAQPDPTQPIFSCRYSREFYENRFPDVEQDLHAAAASQCYGELVDDGQGSTETLDCSVRMNRGEETLSARFYVASTRECDESLLMMESGDVTECRFGEVSRTLASADVPPSVEPAAVTVEYKRPFELDTDVGGLASREYLFTSPGNAQEYHYFAESVGLFVRAAELGGAASLRLTFADRGGNTAGHQAWPR